MWVLRVILVLELADLMLAEYTCAECRLTPNPNLIANDNRIFGDVLFYQENGNNIVKYGVSAYGFKPSPTATQHGFHVHQYGNITGGCGATGSHFNPDGAHHGDPNDSNRHVGDLGNIMVNPDGTFFHFWFWDNVISLKNDNPHNIIGLAVVIHAHPDDMGAGGFADSLTTGHAGARLACCVIESIPCNRPT